MNNILFKQQGDSKKVVYLLGVLCFLLLCAYGYLIQHTVMQVVAKEKAQSVIGALRSQVALLETQHFNYGQAITVERAHTLGFIDAVNVAYIERGVTSGLTLNHAR